MFNFFKKKDQKKQPKAGIDPMYDFKWYDPGEGNPFNKRILDIRPFTQQMISTTKDHHVADLFLKSRASIGHEYVGFEFKNTISIDTQLLYPHNGNKIEGAGYKAKAMEDKWDIYVWNDIIYFVRSWNGDVGYKAFISYNDKSFTVYKIEFEGQTATNDEQSVAINNVHFLILTLAFKAVQPHKIPEHLVTNEEIAAYSFSSFGHNCWYATYDDVIDTVITPGN
jgi:hypothetical protein